MNELFQNHLTGGRTIAVVQPLAIVDDIHKTGNNIWVSFMHGTELIMSPVPDRFGDRQILDAYTDKEQCELVEGADDILDGVAWEFKCESGNDWMARVIVQPWFKTARSRKPIAYMVAGHVFQIMDGKPQAHPALVHVEID